MAITGTTADVGYGIDIRWGRNTVDSSSEYVNPYTTIQRTTGSVAAATSAWTQIAVVRKDLRTYRDELPADGKRRWYRLQHTFPGYMPSTWLGEVDAKPV
jgi:hypothetical protein